jgi:hypothetical protein
LLVDTVHRAEFRETLFRLQVGDILTQFCEPGANPS